MTSLNDEARRAVQDAVDALRQWRSEIDAVNERGLTRAMDRMEAAQQALGWPNRVTTETGPSAVLPGKMHYFMVLDAVREQLLKSSKEDMRVIDKVAEACYASLLPQASLSLQTAVSPQLGPDWSPAETPKRNKLPVFAAVFLALGAIGYAIHDQSVGPVGTAVNNDKYVDGVGANQMSAEATVTGEPSVPPGPQPSATAPQPEQTASAAQSATTPEPPSATGARKVTVEIGAHASQQQATRNWRELQRRSPELFVGHLSGIRKVKRQGGPTWLLVIQNFADKKTAVQFCESLHYTGAQCVIREME